MRDKQRQTGRACKGVAVTAALSAACVAGAVVLFILPDRGLAQISPDSAAAQIANEALAANHLERIFADDEQLLGQLKDVLQRGLEDDKALRLGSTIATLVIRQETETGTSTNFGCWVIGAYRRGWERPLGLHRDGYFKRVLHPDLWTETHGLIRNMARDRILYADDDAQEHYRILEQSWMRGDISSLAKSMDRPYRFTLASSDPSAISPLLRIQRVQQVVVTGMLARDQGKIRIQLQLPSNRMAGRGLAAIVALKRAFESYLQPKAAREWWAYEALQTSQSTHVKKQYHMLEIRAHFGRVMVNVIMKALERLGRDLAMQRLVNHEKLSPALADERLREASGGRYWSAAHRPGLNWPFAFPGTVEAEKFGEETLPYLKPILPRSHLAVLDPQPEGEHTPYPCGEAAPLIWNHRFDGADSISWLSFDVQRGTETESGDKAMLRPPDANDPTEQSIRAWAQPGPWPYGDEILVDAGNGPTALTSNRYYDMGPRSHGSQVTWYGWDGHDYEVFLHDTETGQTSQITSNQFDDVSPVLWDGTVAWEAYPSIESDIFLWKGNRIVKVSDNVEDDLNPRIWNGYVVWQGFDGDDFEIYYYDGTNTIKLTSNIYNDVNPEIRDGWACWMGDLDHWDSEIFVWKIGSWDIHQLTHNEMEDRGPVTHSGRMAWLQDLDNGLKQQLMIAEPDATPAHTPDSQTSPALTEEQLRRAWPPWFAPAFQTDTRQTNVVDALLEGLDSTHEGTGDGVPTEN